MRCILIILDGLGDRGHDCFDGATPLQAAYTPNLDYLSSLGMNGLFHATMQGIPMSSETAHFIIFGYDAGDFPGRGPIEAIGKGIDIGYDDVAVLCHMCYVEQRQNNLILKWGRPVISGDESRMLMHEIQSFETNGVSINLIPSSKIDGFLVLNGNASEKITDSDPIYEGKPLMEIVPISQKKTSPASKKTAHALNKYLIWCHKILSDHQINKNRITRGLPPVNAIVTQRAGKRKKLPAFREMWGMRGLSISSGAIYWGLCSELGIDTIKVKDTGNVEEDLKYRLRLAKDAGDYDFIHVHTKMPDEAGHTKNPSYKKEVIEAIDRAMSVAVNEIIPDRETLLVVTADHSTASSGAMIHTGETVPLMMIGKHVRKDKVGKFNEVTCPRGALGIIRGRELRYLILNFLDRAKLQGLMDTPADQPYYPGNYRPLTL
ncbi:MAG: 2,3-bisphosphoglycerate-independent phosphoglycerate mutase [Nitrospirae bacterium]|nr:2,3-bisphosphoglycerate-independent phosphoglycerate mutase [Nitrospirota bacterium]